MYSESSSDTNLIVITKRDRIKLFCKIYWRTLIVIINPIVLLPIAFIGNNNAYKCLYVYLVTTVYWITDAIHPGIISMVPIALCTIMGTLDKDYFCKIHIHNSVLECLGVMLTMAAVEHSQVHRRFALKLLLLFGCSHCRLSFILFFSSMLLSMVMSNTSACGIMIPLLKAVLVELEKLGILEIYQIIGKAKQKSSRHELNSPRPTDLTVFYFLGIAYSSSIGGMATMIGSRTNQIFKFYCESIFPKGPKIEFPHFMLLNLPGVLLMESLVYLWMNFYFLRMFRVQSDISLEIGMTEEEAEYINALLSRQYHQLGRVRFHEIAVTAIVIVIAIFQATTAIAYLENHTNSELHSYIKMSSPSTICGILMFLVPINLEFTKFLKTDIDRRYLPSSPSRSCLNWKVAHDYVHWSVLFVTASSSISFEALKDSGMTDELERFLLLFKSWPAPALAIIVIVFCKILTESATNSSVVYSLLPNIARLSIVSNVHPHYLMLASTLSSSLPFHLVTGTPANAMVSAYFHIPPWKMMYAGMGPSVIAVVVIWFTVTVWSKTIWTDINVDPDWADQNVFTQNTTF